MQPACPLSDPPAHCLPPSSLQIRRAEQDRIRKMEAQDKEEEQRKEFEVGSTWLRHVCDVMA